MKFIHIADMHFDAPFTMLSNNNLGETRRLDQRKAFRKMIDYIKKNNIELLFICGDLYEHEYVRNTTITYINELFKTIPNTEILIVPGNHDPNVKSSYYNQFKWADNVHIFLSKIEKYSTEKIDIYGYGFNDFYMKNSKINELKVDDDNKVNIFLTHGSLDSGDVKDKEYNPIYKKDLMQMQFDYIGLGHIHKPFCGEINNKIIVYPGSTISLGFDELGEHGMILGDINEKTKKIDIQFIPLDDKEFVELEVKVDNIYTKEELIEVINKQRLEDNKYYKIILTGKRNFEINTYDIYKYIEDEDILKIKDQTKMKIDLEKLSKENSLKGIYVKNLLEKIDEMPDEKDTIMKIIEIGIEAMDD